PALLERLACACKRLRGRRRPERVRVLGAERTVVGEDLDVVEAVPTGCVECAQDPGQVAHAVTGQRAVGPAPRRLAVVSDMDADAAVDLALDVVVERRPVP